MIAKINSFFKISDRGSSIRIELLGGLTTFITMSYIVFVNPNILSITGMDKEALITTTCLVSALGTLLIALLANVPIALAPGMGLNAFFTFSLVIGQGISWQEALGVVFLSGLLFFIMSLSGIRKKIAAAIPHSVMIAATAGIGLFVAFIGLQSMKFVVLNEATIVGLGEFTPTLCISLISLATMIILELKRVKGGIFIGVMLGTVISIMMGYTEAPTSLVSLPPSIEPIAFKLDILGALKWSLIGPIFSFMFIDMFDSLAFLLACNKQMGLDNKDGEDENLGRMLISDVSATLFGSMLGSSTLTSFAESATGIATGARTGLASIVTGALFLVALFFSPVISIVPSYASAPALVIVGIFMFQIASELDFKDMRVAIPSFFTLILMPLTYSISYGLSFGFLSYILVHICTKEFSKISPTLWIIGVLCVINLVL